MDDETDGVRLGFDILCIFNTLLYTVLNMVTTKRAPAEKVFFFFFLNPGYSFRVTDSDFKWSTSIYAALCPP